MTGSLNSDINDEVNLWDECLIITQYDGITSMIQFQEVKKETRITILELKYNLNPTQSPTKNAVRNSTLAYIDP